MTTTARSRSFRFCTQRVSCSRSRCGMNDWTGAARSTRAAGNVDGDWKSLGRAPWVLNPPGCFLRAMLIDKMERAGFAPMIAAEIHNMHLQLAFVQSGYGVGLLPARFIARHRSIDSVKV